MTRTAPGGDPPIPFPNESEEPSPFDVADEAWPDDEPEPAASIDDIEYVDRLAERVRRRAVEREQTDARMQEVLARERRETLVEIRGLLLRRIAQFGMLVRDAFLALAGSGARAASAVAEGAGDATALAESYRQRFRRRLLGRTTVYRLEYAGDGFLDRSAVACDAVDLDFYVVRSRRSLPVLVIGRFDRCRAFLRGFDARPRGLRVTVRRRPSGDSFVLRDVHGHRLPPLPPETTLLLLAHDGGGSAPIELADVLRRVALKSSSTAVLVRWNADLIERVHGSGEDEAGDEGAAR